MHNYGFPFNFSLFILDNSKFLNSKRFFLLLCVYIIFITWKVHNQKTDIKIKNRAVLLLWIYRLWAIILHFGECEKKLSWFFLLYHLFLFSILTYSIFSGNPCEQEGANLLLHPVPGGRGVVWRAGQVRGYHPGGHSGC